MEYCYVSFKGAEAFCRQLFESYGFSEGQAARIADVLLAADLNGIESHGLQRLVRYDQEISWGWVDIHASPETVKDTPISAVIDARGAMGQLASIEAMNLAIAKAKRTGIGMVAVRNNNHYGIAGYYAEMAMREDLIGMCMTNSEAIMVPTHGSQPMIGTNPIALSMPADPFPFLFDAATTVVPRGKLEVLKKRGQRMPQGWAVDERGLQSDDPASVLDGIIKRRGGGILPLGGAGEAGGGHKGYGLGLIVEIMTSILGQGTTSDGIYRTPGQANIASSFVALDHGAFGDKRQIRDELSRYLQKLRDAAKAEGQQRIYTPGEKEIESRARVRGRGIPVSAATLSEMRRIAGRQGVDTAPLDGANPA